MITKQQKEKFVQDASAELKKYKSVGILGLDKVPDMLLQETKNRLRGKARFIAGRKNLLKKVLESDSNSSKLIDMLDGTCAILLTNEDPFELFSEFKAGSIMLPAKPKQKSPSDINIEPGETTLQPGQAVTELKQAGIDVQIQKGKVVIGKGKTIVKAGETISNAVSKALHTLNIKPIEASILPSVIFSNGVIFRKDVLGIDRESTVAGIMKSFQEALALSKAAGIVNAYTIKEMLSKAFNNAMYLGVERNIYTKETIDRLIGKASSEASALDSMIKK